MVAEGLRDSPAVWSRLRGPAAGLLGWMACLLAPLLIPVIAIAQADTTIRDRYYLDWLAAVEHLMLNAEYETFLTLDDDADREHFIRRFWEVRWQDPQGWRNKAHEGWRRNFEQATAQYGGLDSDRARAMLLAGKPDRVMALRRCAGPVRDLEIWSFSPWQIERQTGGKETDGFYLVFFVDGGEEEGFFFRQWAREEGFAALVWEAEEDEEQGEEEEEGEEWTEERWLELAGAKNCFDFDPQQKVTVETALAGALGEVELFERIRPPVPDAGWLGVFVSELSAGTAAPVSDAVELEVAGGYEGRALVRGRVEVPLAEVGRTGEGYLFDRFVITGDVWSGGVPIDDFRVEHHVSGVVPESSGGLLLDVYRLLPPGTYTVSLRVEDDDGFGVARAVREVVVPWVSGGAAAPAGDKSLDELTARRVEVATALASVQLRHPAGEAGGNALVAGKAEVRAVTTGDVARVDFLLDGELAASAAAPPFAAPVRFGRLPRRRTLEGVAYGDAGRELARDRIVVNGGPHRFALRLVEPSLQATVASSNGRASSARRIHAVVEVPERRTLDRVELYLDQTRLATLYQPPFLHPLPESLAREATFVRAVARLQNGEAVEDLRFLEYRGSVDRIDVRLVELYTSVTDAAGRFLLGLGKGDFRVFEDGAEQTMTRFETIDRLPIHVALLLDVSGSMKPRLEIATESALRFFDTVIDPTKDKAALLTFNHAVRLRVPFTDDLDRLRYAVTDLAAWQATRLHDGVIHAGHYFGGLAGKRALVLLSDGEDVGSSFLFKQVLEHTLRSGVAVYPIAVDLVDPLTRKRLKQLAAETGGSFYSVGGVDQLDEVYRRLEQELRSQYLLVYHAPDARRDEFRTVEVRVASPNAGGDLRAKTIHGYYP